MTLQQLPLYSSPHSSDYHSLPGAWDEMWDAEAGVRPHWAHLVGGLARLRARVGGARATDCPAVARKRRHLSRLRRSARLYPHLGTGPDGGVWVMSDRTQSPSGVGYALESRAVMARTFPELLEDAGVARLTGWLDAAQGALAGIAPAGRDQPRVVVLTPDPAFVGQQALALSTVPALHDNRLLPQKMSLRAFLVSHEENHVALPGALTRCTSGEHLSGQRGALSKDTWLTPAPPRPSISHPLPRSITPGDSEILTHVQEPHALRHLPRPPEP